MSKKTFLAVALCLICAVLSAADFVLYKGGRSMADFVVEIQGKLPQKEANSIRHTINGFNAGMKKCLLPPTVRVAKARPGRNCILLKIEDRLIPEKDRYTVSFPNKNTMEILCTSASLKFALDELQEKAFGVRFLFHSPHWLKPPKGYDRSIEYEYPKVKNASIAAKGYTRKPDFNFKRYYSGDIPKEWGLRHSFATGHGIPLYAYPAKKYAHNNSWPKEILPIHNGKVYKMPKPIKPDPRKKNNKYYMDVQQYIQYLVNWNPCFTHPKSAEIAAANILELLEKEPLNIYGEKQFSLSLGINDNGGNCECKRCLAVLKKHGRGRFTYGAVDYSEPYWAWVNRIAEIVTKKHPNMYFNCLAYREVTNPPSFKLHPNVIPMVCRELYAGSCPKEKKKIQELFKAWKEKADIVFIWDYAYGSKYYVFPRIFFNVHRDMMKILHENNVKGIYCESGDRINMGGPAYHFIGRSMWDVNFDVNKALKKWCIDAVGPKAAPELEEYYKFWEKFWLREDVRKTNFFNSVSNIYMSLGDPGSYTYAIKKGEMAKLRKLMENVVKKAQTPTQKARAKHFYNVFCISEAAAKCLYSEFIEPNGFVKDSANAVALLRSIPEAYKTLRKLEKNPLVNHAPYEQRLLPIIASGFRNLRPIEKFTKEPAVRKALDELGKNTTLPPEIRAQAKILAGATFQNILGDKLTFEKPLPGGSFWQIYRGRINTNPAFVSQGKRSFGGVNPLVREVQSENLIRDKKYMVLVDVYATKVSAEGYANLLVNPMREGRHNTQYNLLSRLKLKQGWQTLSNTISFSGRGDGPKELFIQVWGQKFEKDEPIYFDNIRVYQLD